VTRRSSLLCAAAAAVVWVLTFAAPGTFRSGIVLQGVLAGSSSGLLALGLVLIFKTTGVVNLSYQAMGACAAQLGATAYLHYGWPWPVAIAVALIGGAAAGGATDLLLRRFEGAPRLVVTVATIGLLQVFTALQVLIPHLLGSATLVVSFPTGLSSHSRVVGTTPFFGDDLLALVLVPIALGGLGWFLNRTDAGVAVRGIAENGDRALLLGIPARRLVQLVWVLAGVLSAAVAIFAAPRSGIPANPFVSTGGLFLPALAAAVIARLESLPVAFVAAVGLGVTEWVVKDNVSKQALGTVVMFVVIIVTLLTQRRRGGRAVVEDGTDALGQLPPALPRAIAGLREIVLARRVLVAAVVLAAVLVPVLAGPSTTHRYAGYLLLGMAAVSVTVISGWSGTVSLGQYAIVGVGAVTVGDLMVKQNADLLVSLVAGTLAGGLIGLLLGAPALRIRPLFVLVSSLAFAAAMDQFFLNPVNYPSWIPTDVLRPVLWKRYPLGSERAAYYLCLALLVLTVLVVRALRNGRPGRTTIAARDNGPAAAALGLSVLRVRVTAMVLAGMIAGLAGGLSAVLERGVGGSAFPVQTSVLVFSMAVVGGLGSVSGALAGVFVTELVLGLVRTAFPDVAGLASLATGTLLLGVLLALPGGITGALSQVRDRIAAKVAARHGLSLTVGAAGGSDDVEPGEAVRADPGEGSGVLWCRDLTASYGPLQVLFGVDLDVRENEIVALLGTNGAGKSTVLRALMGRMGSAAGAMAFAGSSIAGRTTDDIARQGIALMPGGRGVFPTLTVAENLRLAGWQLRARPERARVARDEVDALFPALATRLAQRAGDLSGGEQQQLSLAMALLTQPRVLLIDELSLGLAPAVVGTLAEKIREVNASGVTVVIVEQSVNVALTLAQRAVFLEKGSVRFEGPTADLLERPDLLRSVFLGDATGASGGRSLTASGGATRGGHLHCDGVVKRFGGITAVDHVDLDVRAGRIVGLIGHNGAGKTTLFDLISGFQSLDGGSIRIDGVEVATEPAHRRVVAGLGRSFQQARLFPSLTVEESILVALDRHLEVRGTAAAGLALPAALDAEAEADARASEIIDLLGLGGFAETPIAALSTGTRRIVELACVLAVEPTVLLLDEPSAGVAQKDTEALGHLLREVRDRTGCTIVVIEHDMALLTDLCDELVALELGAVIARGTPAEVLADPLVIESYLGTDDAAIQRSGPGAKVRR
jgi:ABC-type branched-subunit amino acid transport system ATPase component/ABC-type branched-subunit amino acid transport system permease subunit